MLPFIKATLVDILIIFLSKNLFTVKPKAVTMASVCTFLFSADLWKEKFKNCRMENATFLHPKKGCHLNFQEENDIVIYMVSFLGSLAVLPGNIISALFMDKVGRIRIIGEMRRMTLTKWLCLCRASLICSSVFFFFLGGSMLASSACSFLLLLSFSQGAVICWQCLFYGTSVAAWNGLQVISVELYPSSKRYSTQKNSSCASSAFSGKQTIPIMS